MAADTAYFIPLVIAGTREKGFKFVDAMLLVQYYP